MRTFAPKRQATQPTTSARPAISGRGHFGQSPEMRSILPLQRTLGNQAEQPMLRTEAEALEAELTGTGTRCFGRDFSRIPIHASAASLMQPKLVIDRPQDSYEQEADRVSEQIMRMSEPRLQRNCACGSTQGSTEECKECGKQRLSLQRTSLDAAHQVDGGYAPPIVQDVLRSPAVSLDPQTRAFMERHFGHDFSRVRIHADAGASQAADAVQAQAFTVGSDIVFGSGKFATSTPDGRKLLAHELTHVVQQTGAPAAAAHEAAAGEAATEAKELRTSRLSEPGRLQRQPKAGKHARKTEACPPMEPHEREEAAKAQLQLVERIPQQEWLIYGFPIGGTDIPGGEAGGFISAIVRSLMQGHFVYMTGQDPLEVLGFSDCFAGPKVDNRAIREARAANFCAGVKEHYASTPKTYPALIRFCGPAPMDESVGPNATRADRVQNRSILVRRVAAAKFRFEEGGERYPFDPTYGPSPAHCAAYKTPQTRDILGRVYMNNAYCSCMVTPDEPHNNCVRSCLQDKMWNLLANASRDRKPGDPPMDINLACPLIWKHHRECYHDCGCTSEFIDYLAFDAVCNIALPCAVDSAAINLVNRCMPAT